MPAERMAKDQPIPLVYSCSGCSNVAQLTNAIAVALNRDGVAEMSCIAGLGGDVKPLVKKAKSGRKIVCLDGCPLRCALSTLARHDISPTYYIQLADLRIKKRYNEDCSVQESQLALRHVYEVLGRTPPQQELREQALAQ